MSESEKIMTLVHEGLALSRIGGRIQQEIPSHFSADDLADFRARYKRWYEQALPLVHSAMRSGFEEAYEGNASSTGIRVFLRHAITPREADVVDTPKSDMDRFLYWRYDSITYFTVKMTRQVTALQHSYSVSRLMEPVPAFDLVDLHPAVRVAARKPFRDGHRGYAVFQSCLALKEAVQKKSGCSDLDGTKLMQRVFSANEPLLRIAGHPDEQQGYMFLFSGVMAAIRNPRAHRSQDDEADDLNESLELLSLISLLFRALDRASPDSTPS